MIVCPWKDLARYAPVIPGLKEAADLINNLENLDVATYPLSCGKVMVAAGTTKAAEGRQLEAHRQYLDIQYVVSGSEVMGWAPVDSLTPSGEFNVEKDAGMYTGKCEFVNIEAGWCYVVFPEDAHAPGTHTDEPTEYQKLIIKLKV